jgi:serine/threonine protein kinase
MIITEKIEVSDGILASGGFADVRCGKYMGRLVAVKTMRVPEHGDFLKVRKVSIDDPFPATWNAISIIFPQRFCKEVVLWSTLSHPNVLKLVGVQGDMGTGQFVTVSEWMAHGNIMGYIKKNRTNRLELVRNFTSPATSLPKTRQ